MVDGNINENLILKPWSIFLLDLLTIKGLQCSHPISRELIVIMDVTSHEIEAFFSIFFFSFLRISNPLFKEESTRERRDGVNCTFIWIYFFIWISVSITWTRILTYTFSSWMLPSWNQKWLQHITLIVSKQTQEMDRLDRADLQNTFGSIRSPMYCHIGCYL